MPRALKNLDITLGLAVIPVQLFTATSSQGVAFRGKRRSKDSRPRRTNTSGSSPRS
jgi:hypothetical protein